MAWHLAEVYGMKRFCRNVRAVEIPVLDLSDSKVISLMIEECKRSLVEDGAEAIVLGCAGMVDLCEIIGPEIGVPVIDGVTAAVKFVESLVALRLFTSKRGDYALPLPKNSCTGTELA
jgi:allantoin racemase